ncbi:viral A-type inclusion protein [Reticulomyxa filosa]|uniref:Viral A-type inclusion protein n=1 Tax=Reticulomyxa filosa TaxID=46433 RepID=X6N3H4_RETFI|nr:viral A-type inclusion protein [Reticulomyxa filosa]|eukprot:ETO20830.1 viral A-type inclusion protein [Reticulomyxa filosa]
MLCIGKWEKKRELSVQLTQWINEFGKPAQKQCEEYRKENEKLLDEKRRIEMQVEQLTQEIQSLQFDNEELTKCIDKLNRLDKERSDNCTFHTKTLQQMRNEMENQLAQTEQELQEAKAMIANLMETSRSQSATITKLSRENTKFSIENQTHVQTIEALRDNTKKLEDELSSLQSLNHVYMNDMMTLRNQIDELNMQLAHSSITDLSGPTDVHVAHMNTHYLMAHYNTTEINIPSTPPARVQSDTTYTFDKRASAFGNGYHRQKTAVRSATNKHTLDKGSSENDPNLDDIPTRQQATSISEGNTSDLELHDDNVSVHSGGTARPLPKLSALAKPCNTSGTSNRERLNHVYNQLQKQKTTNLMLDLHGMNRSQIIDRQIGGINIDGKNKLALQRKGAKFGLKETHGLPQWGNWTEENVTSMVEKVSESVVLKIQDKIQIWKNETNKKKKAHHNTKEKNNAKDDEDTDFDTSDEETQNQEEKTRDEDKAGTITQGDVLTLSSQILREVMSIKELTQTNSNQLRQLQQHLNDVPSSDENTPQNSRSQTQNRSNENVGSGIQIMTSEDLWKSLEQRFGILRTNISSDLNAIVQQNKLSGDSGNVTTSGVRTPQHWWEWW